MSQAQPAQPPLTHPLNYILSTQARLRLVRVLAGRQESASVNFLASAAHLAIPSVYVACRDLEHIGFLARTGTGGAQSWRLSPRHPLVPAIMELFRQEKKLSQEIEQVVRSALLPLDRSVLSAWLEYSPSRPDAKLNIITPPAALPQVLSVLRDQLAGPLARLGCSLTVSGLAPAEITDAIVNASLAARPLWGLAPASLLPSSTPAPAAGRTKSRATHDKKLRQRGGQWVEELRRDPQLRHESLKSIEEHLRTADQSIRPALEAWRHALGHLELEQLNQLLTADEEWATFLRQSAPFLNLANRVQPPPAHSRRSSHTL